MAEKVNTDFITLYNKNVNDRVAKKKAGGVTLSYLSWAYAWAETKKEFPDAEYKIHTFGEDAKPYLLDNDLGYMVMTTVTINGLAHTMWLPVLDHSNKAMKNVSYEYTVRSGTRTVEQATMFDINTSLMRCLVKNLAMHGLGLYIYAGEDLPVVEIDEKREEQERAEKKAVAEQNKKKENAKYQKMLVNMFNELVEELGSNELIYEKLNMKREEYVQRYRDEPKELFEYMQTEL